MTKHTYYPSDDTAAQYWADRAGEQYGVLMTREGRVLALCGPLHYSEVTWDNLPNLEWDYAAADGINPDAYRLVELA